MGILDRLLGRDEEDVRRSPAPQRQPTRYDATAQGPQQPQQRPAASAPDADAQAIERYRYMLRTAPPGAIEQAHAEAFSNLTPDQRQRVLAEISRGVPAAERPQNDDPQSLARAATRAEMRQPGFMERTFGGVGLGGAGMVGGAGPMMGGGMMGPSMGAVIGGSLLSGIAGSFIGSSIAHAFFDNHGFGGGHGGPDVVNNYYDNDTVTNNEYNELGQPDGNAFNDGAPGDGWRDSDLEGVNAGDADLAGGYDSAGLDSGFDAGGDFGGGDFGGGDFA